MQGRRVGGVQSHSPPPPCVLGWGTTLPSEISRNLLQQGKASNISPCKRGSCGQQALLVGTSNIWWFCWHSVYFLDIPPSQITSISYFSTFRFFKISLVPPPSSGFSKPCAPDLPHTTKFACEIHIPTYLPTSLYFWYLLFPKLLFNVGALNCFRKINSMPASLLITRRKNCRKKSGSKSILSYGSYWLFSFKCSLRSKFKCLPKQSSTSAYSSM